MVSSEFLLLRKSQQHYFDLKRFLPFSYHVHLWAASCQHSGEECGETPCVFPIVFLYSCRYMGDKRKQVTRPRFKALFIFPVSPSSSLE